jgi:hypothetical protein
MAGKTRGSRTTPLWRERDARNRKRMKGHFMRRASQELTLRSVLSDPLIRLVMEADRVDPRALEVMLTAIASRIRRRRNRRELATESTPLPIIDVYRGG